MSGIGIILNCNAGKRKIFQSQVDQKLAFVLGDGDSFRQTGTIDEIEEVARWFLDREIDILGISGGDGSNHYTLTTFIKVYGDHPLPKVTFLRGGTHNAHAISIGLRGKPEDILDRIVRQYHAGQNMELIQRKILKVDDGNTVRYGFTLGTGFLCQFYQQMQLRQAESPLKLVGFLASSATSILAGSRNIRNMFHVHPATITVSEQVVPWPEHNSVTCSAMESVGMGFKPYPRANEKLEDFQAAILRIQPRAFVKLMLGCWMGKMDEHPDVYNILTDCLVIQADRSESYVLDGEIYNGTNRLEISTGPRIDILMG